jgi:hypothetical protein
VANHLDELADLIAADLKAGKKAKSLTELPSEYRQGMTDVAFQKAMCLGKRQLRLEKLTELTSGKVFKALFPNATVQIVGNRIIIEVTDVPAAN